MKMTDMRKCIRIPKREGEQVRSELLSKGILDIKRKISSEGEHLIIPILTDEYEDYEVIEADLESLDQKITDYRDAPEISEDIRSELPTSFDVIGDVAIIKLPDTLMPYRHQIGSAMMSVNNSLRTVMADRGVKGDLRIRELEQIAGKGSSETIHKEFGVRMIIDPSEVYFNPRLATERSRIAALVVDGETIIDMFAGVAPFGLVICKTAKPKIVYSIDLNPDAEKFARKNMELNHIENIVPITGDSSEVIKRLPDADRIIMNLPQTADSFLIDALRNTKAGGIIHLHKIIDRSGLDAFAERIKNNADSYGFEILVEKITELKTYSPTMSVYVFDIKKQR
jgi:tRNA (guanine37-N1)-methyltransferase